VRVHPVQQALLRPHSPLEKTPHKAGVISVAGSIAVIAFFEMATEGRGAADLDGSHYAQLRERKRVSFPVGSAISSKDVGHFQSGPRHPLLPGLLLRFVSQSVEWALGGRNDMRRYSDVARRGFDAAMTQ